MNGEREQPPDFFGDYVVRGTVIRLMWDYGVRVPLWDAEGLLPEEPEWLRQSLGLSDAMIESLTNWGQAMIELDAKTGRPSATLQRARSGELKEQGQHLANQLHRELSPGFAVDYRPW